MRLTPGDLRSEKGPPLRGAVAPAEESRSGSVRPGSTRVPAGSGREGRHCAPRALVLRGGERRENGQATPQPSGPWGDNRGVRLLDSPADPPHIGVSLEGHVRLDLVRDRLRRREQERRRREGDRQPSRVRAPRQPGIRRCARSCWRSPLTRCTRNEPESLASALPWGSCAAAAASTPQARQRPRLQGPGRRLRLRHPRRRVPAGRRRCRRDYAGTLGTQAMAVHLVQTGHAVTGAYLYARVGRPIAIVGTSDPAGQLVLDEKSDGETTGRWHLRPVDQGLRGQINNPKGTKTFPVQLSPGGPVPKLVAGVPSAGPTHPAPGAGSGGCHDGLGRAVPRPDDDTVCAGDNYVWHRTPGGQLRGIARRRAAKSTAGRHRRPRSFLRAPPAAASRASKGASTTCAPMDSCIPIQFGRASGTLGRSIRSRSEADTLRRPVGVIPLAGRAVSRHRRAVRPGEDVPPIVHERLDPEAFADRRLLRSRAAEVEMVGSDAGRLEEAPSAAARPASCFLWTHLARPFDTPQGRHTVACRGDPHEGSSATQHPQQGVDGHHHPRSSRRRKRAGRVPADVRQRAPGLAGRSSGYHDHELPFERVCEPGQFSCLRNSRGLLGNLAHHRRLRRKPRWYSRLLAERVGLRAAVLRGRHVLRAQHIRPGSDHSPHQRYRWSRSRRDAADQPLEHRLVPDHGSTATATNFNGQKTSITVTYQCFTDATLQFACATQAFVPPHSGQGATGCAAGAIQPRFRSTAWHEGRGVTWAWLA